VRTEVIVRARELREAGGRGWSTQGESSEGSGGEISGFLGVRWVGCSSPLPNTGWGGGTLCCLASATVSRCVRRVGVILEWIGEVGSLVHCLWAGARKARVQKGGGSVKDVKGGCGSRREGEKRQRRGGDLGGRRGGGGWSRK